MSATSYMTHLKFGNNTWEIRDAGARELISALGDTLYWIGVTTTELEDNVTTSAVITVGGESVTAKIGGMAQYNGEEFVYNGTKWQSIGKNNFGDLAFASSVDVSASGSYTPAGSVELSGGSAQTVVTGIGSATTATIKEFDGAGSVTAGSAASFSQGSDTFTQGTDSFTQGEDSFTQGTDTMSVTVDNGICEFSFTQGTDTFTQGTDSFTQGEDSFTQGSDTFTANVPTAVSLPTSKDTTVVTAQGEATTGSVTVPDTATFTGTAATVSVTGSGLPHTS